MNKTVEFVKYFVDQIVDYPQEVIVRSTKDEMGVFITLQVAKADMGKIIGKNGETINAMRVLLRVLGYKEKARVSLKTIEPDQQ